jgi:hypothetical protein
MPKNDVIKEVISKIEKEVVEVQYKIDELEKRRERIHQRRILNGIRSGTKNNISII